MCVFPPFELHTYTAAQFHFHAPSEHFVEGEQFDLEMHIVMANDAGIKVDGRAYGVLGFLFREDSTAPDIELLEGVLSNMAEARRRMLSGGAAASPWGPPRPHKGPPPSRRPFRPGLLTGF